MILTGHWFVEVHISIVISHVKRNTEMFYCY